MPKPEPVPPGIGLHQAALLDDVGAIRQHIKIGSDLNKKDAYRSSPLIVATTFDKTQAAKPPNSVSASIFIPIDFRNETSLGASGEKAP